MARVIQITGTNGSGKTTIVYDLMRRFRSRPIYGALGHRYPEAYELNIEDEAPLFILGPYGTPTGGSDRMGFQVIISLIKKYRPRGHVLFEGLITSGYKGQSGELLETFGKDSVVMFMDTPLDVCIERVLERRKQAGNKTELNPHNIEKKYEAVERTFNRYIREDTLIAIKVSVEEGADKVLDLCRNAFECPMCHAPGATADGCGICGSGPDG